MKTIIKEIQVYTFNELSEAAKEAAKRNILDVYHNSDFFTDYVLQELKASFPNSDLHVTYSLGYCQGDGLNIEGKLYLPDYIPIWETIEYELSEKEKRTIKFYSDYMPELKFSRNNHYGYSCKFIDIQNMDNEINETINNLEYCNISNINKQLISKFYWSVLNYFETLDKKYENEGYNYFYDLDEAELSDIIENNEIDFLENGDIY